MRRLIRVLAAFVFGLVAGSARADGPKADIHYWMSQEVQLLPVERRLGLLAELVRAAAGRLDPRFCQEAFIRDPAAQVKLKLLDCHVARFAGNWRMLSRLDQWFPADLLADYELTCAAADIVVAHTEKNRSIRRRTATFLVMVLENMPYPEMPPADGKVKVTYSNGLDRRRRPRTRQVELDAAQARRARELFGKALAHLNRIARKAFRPSPKVQEEIEAWWQASGQGWVFVAEDQWASIRASGYATIKSPAPARVVASTYLGTKGTEWLAGGGFQPDGTVVVAGTCLGPSFDLSGPATKVLGPDGRAPGQPKGEPHPADRGAAFCWMHSQGTPFVVRLAPDLKSVRSAARLPWCSGAVTSAAVDATGHVYLAGPARKALRQVGAAEKDIHVTVHSRAFTAETILRGTRKKSLAEAGVKD